MKICGIICEFNPFHNGHKYLLEQVRELSHCDYLICIMSASFTQRGDICIADKYVRAKHAVFGGADCVLELPVSFAVAPAEIFAKGAIKILSNIPHLNTLAFGCERANHDLILSSAKLLLNETAEFKEILNCNLNDGESFIKSYQMAFERCGGCSNLLTQPNNILAIEYTKTILRNKVNIDILPIKRIGSGYGDRELKDNYSSASAIRANFLSPAIKGNVPDYVFSDLKDFSKQQNLYESYLKLILSRTNAEDLKRIYGCSEGLENALKSLENEDFCEIIAKLTSKRYSSSRIKRILCANFLNLYQDDCERYLGSELYLKPLAVKKDCADKILSILSASEYPTVTSGSDKLKLNEAAKECKRSDDFAYAQWQQITGYNSKDKILII